MINNDFFKCISCPVAHIILSEYLNTYIMNKSGTAKYKEDTKMKTTSADKLSKLFYVSDDDVRKFDSFIEKLLKNSEGTITSDSLTKFSCLCNIKQIIPTLKKFSDDTADPMDYLKQLNEYDMKVLIEIEKFFNENKIKLFFEPLKKGEKELSDKFLKSIGLSNNKNIFGYSFTDSEEYCNEDAETSFYKYCDLVYGYIENISESIQYKCCDKSYKNFLKEISIEQFTNCKGDIVNMSRINNIMLNCTVLSAILCDYLKKAPKNPTNLIDLLMKKQGLTDTIIAILLFGNPEEKANIKKWHKPNDSTEELPKQAKLHLKELAKIFLVSEDVLRCGTGKIYGNWKIALDENKNINFQNELLTSEDNEELQKIDNPKQRRPAVITKKHIYERIKSFISQTDEQFKEMIIENPDFFYEEDFCLFTYTVDGKECYDFEAMYKSLIHPEDFDTLLSVLEELQAKENIR